MKRKLLNTCSTYISKVRLVDEITVNKADAFVRHLYVVKLFLLTRNIRGTVLKRYGRFKKRHSPQLDARVLLWLNTPQKKKSGPGVKIKRKSGTRDKTIRVGRENYPLLFFLFFFSPCLHHKRNLLVMIGRAILFYQKPYLDAAARLSNPHSPY